MCDLIPGVPHTPSPAGGPGQREHRGTDTSNRVVLAVVAQLLRSKIRGDECASNKFAYREAYGDGMQMIY